MNDFLKRTSGLIPLLIAVWLLSACGGSGPAMPASGNTGSTAIGAAATTVGASSGPDTSVPTPPEAATTQSASSEQTIAPETNPVGDIPDNQAFVSFTSSSGNYSLDVPEGWARTSNGADVRFTNKFDGVAVKIKPVTAAPTAASTDPQVMALVQSERAFKAGEISEVKLPAGQAVRISATANSDPDPVTGKQVRLEEEIYLFYQNGTQATVQLWAPQGADNVDQWKRMMDSFRWK